ncbi:MAG: hypothetical protein KIS92_17375, partial [Planctomycetota bacterium]|nr:hypothetical protein [Planctomycetota bacterium]
AIECLGTSDEDLAYLLEQSRAKAKDVRAAALRALTASASGADAVLAALKKAVDGDDLELFVERLRDCKHPGLQAYVLQKAEAHLAETLKCKDKKEQGAAIQRMQALVCSLAGRADAPAESFLLHCLECARDLAAIKSEPSGSDLNELVASLLSCGTPKMQKQIAARHAELTGDALRSALLAARATRPPAAFYEEFHGTLKGAAEKRGKKDPAERGRILLGVVCADDDDHGYFYRYWRRGYRYASERPPLAELDPRWLDAAIEFGLPELVEKLARPGHAATQRFLTQELGKAKEPHEARDLLATMVRIGHPEAADAVLSEIRKRGKDTAHQYMVRYYYSQLVADLPRSALPKVEALLPELPEKIVDGLVDAMIALKEKPE